MVLKIPGVGSQYAYTEQGANGNYFDGAETYRLNERANLRCTRVCVSRLGVRLAVCDVRTAYKQRERSSPARSGE
jgi:hypothetical protein